MSGLLADLYSAIDTKKRQLRGLLDDPVETLKQGLLNFRDDQNAALNLFDNAYQVTPGSKTVLNTPEQVKDFQKRTADKAAEMAFAAMSFKYPQDDALMAAQRNAEKMLGLPANNTPAMRAKAMGFDTDAFHGTNRTFHAFDDGMLGVNTGAKSAQKAHFMSGPQTANSYIKTGGIFQENAPPLADLFKTKGAFEEFNAATDEATRWALLEKLGLNKGSGQMIPLNVNLGKNTTIDYGGNSYREITFNDAIKAAKRRKNDSVTFRNAIDGGGEGRASSDDIHAIFNPANIRSRFAAFDPARINENDLLAGALPLGLLADEETRKKLGF